MRKQEENRGGGHGERGAMALERSRFKSTLLYRRSGEEFGPFCQATVLQIVLA